MESLALELVNGVKPAFWLIEERLLSGVRVDGQVTARIDRLSTTILFGPSVPRLPKRG